MSRFGIAESSQLPLLFQLVLVAPTHLPCWPPMCCDQVMVASAPIWTWAGVPRPVAGVPAADGVMVHAQYPSDAVARAGPCWPTQPQSPSSGRTASATPSSAAQSFVVSGQVMRSCLVHSVSPSKDSPQRVPLAAPVTVIAPEPEER